MGDLLIYQWDLLEQLNKRNSGSAASAKKIFNNTLIAHRGQQISIEKYDCSKELNIIELVCVCEQELIWSCSNSK